MAKPQCNRAQTNNVRQEVGQNSTKGGCAIKDSESVERRSLVNSLCNRVKLKVENYKVKSSQVKSRIQNTIGMVYQGKSSPLY